MRVERGRLVGPAATGVSRRRSGGGLTRAAVPDGLPSGVYSARLTVPDGEDRVPFFVRPARGTVTADVAFLAPTLSYLVYGNESSSWTAPSFEIEGLTREDMLPHVDANDRYIVENGLKSLYEVHTDGSGVCYASRRRPVVNMRPGYVMPIVRGGHQLSADLELVDWLGARGVAHDVVTDEDLHAEGVDLLAGYRVVVTGSHPEYWTAAMLDAMERYLACGGRLMYLGGNGFYWVTSIDPERPWTVEVRRGHAGTRVWEGEPGEGIHSTTGEPGGLWRHRGRPPQQLVGVGFTAQGFDRSLPYVRTGEAASATAEAVFSGVADGRPLGDEGTVMGGAAGFEIDRFDARLGTPAHAELLASAAGFSDSYQAVIEEVRASDSRQGGTVNDAVRSDMTFVAYPNGGGVFSVGSIAWCGALSADDYGGPVSRITENVLRTFALGGAEGARALRERVAEQPDVG